MEEGLTGADAYLDRWQWGPRLQREGAAGTLLAAILAELDAEWSARLFGE